MKVISLAAACAAGLCFAGVASAQVMTPQQVSQLASHPRCYVLGRNVVVRGAVWNDTDQAPVPNAIVTLRYAGHDHQASTNAGGVYVATFPASAHAGTVREVQTEVMETGAHIPVAAQEASGSCTVAGVHVGKLQAVH
ncbi:MAG TPA: hypothetical protein VF292_08370 [Rhodanobacteraceae bacterium]